STRRQSWIAMGDPSSELGSFASWSLYPLDAQRVLARERLQLRPREDAGRGADGAHATGPDGAAHTEAALRIQAAQQAVDVAGREGVAAAGAIDERHAVRIRSQQHSLPHQHRSGVAPRDDDRARAQAMERLRLAQHVFLAQD